ncbi:MAG: GntR family transcriptional regulator [Thermoleophilia bacterium]
MTADRRPEPAKDRALTFVKRRVLDGTYPGGELLSEGAVAQELGVSRTPVREAFLLLEAEGLMRLYPKRGALVVPVSAGEIRDVMETRLLVERHAAERLAASDDVATQRRLVDQIARQRELLEADDPAAFVDADRLFHATIVDWLGNAILSRLYESLRDRQRRMTAATLARDPQIARRYLDEHRRIAEAVAGNRPRDAGRLLAAHIEGAQRNAEAFA